MSNASKPGKRRSPIREYILPRPGRETRTRLLDAVHSVVALWVMCVAMAGLMLGESLVLWWRPQDGGKFRGTIIVFSGVVALGGWLYYRKRIERLELGLDGEMAVGQALDALRERGYRVFHSIACDGFDIDHALIGPEGVFAIETKTHSRATGERVTYDGREVLVNGHKPDRDPVAQVEALARHLSKILHDQTGEKVRVRPVVVYPGWWVDVKTPNPSVWVLNPGMLGGFIRQERETLDAKRITVLASGLTRYQQQREPKV